MRRFYVGAKHIGSAIGKGLNAECMRQTPEDAIAEATRMLAENPSMETCAIVEVIALVKRTPPPVIVEFIRDEHSWGGADESRTTAAPNDRNEKRDRY